ncbi:MAG: hypothetical protein ACRC9K_13065 [Afipia sp.]
MTPADSTPLHNIFRPGPRMSEFLSHVIDFYLAHADGLMGIACQPDDDLKRN